MGCFPMEVFLCVSPHLIPRKACSDSSKGFCMTWPPPKKVLCSLNSQPHWLKLAAPDSIYEPLSWGINRCKAAALTDVQFILTFVQHKCSLLSLYAALGSGQRTSHVLIKTCLVASMLLFLILQTEGWDWPTVLSLSPLGKFTAEMGWESGTFWFSVQSLSLQAVYNYCMGIISSRKVSGQCDSETHAQNILQRPHPGVSLPTFTTAQSSPYTSLTCIWARISGLAFSISISFCNFSCISSRYSPLLFTSYSKTLCTFIRSKT